MSKRPPLLTFSYESTTDARALPTFSYELMANSPALLTFSYELMTNAPVLIIFSHELVANSPTLLAFSYESVANGLASRTFLYLPFQDIDPSRSGVLIMLGSAERVRLAYFGYVDDTPTSFCGSTFLGGI